MKEDIIIYNTESGQAHIVLYCQGGNVWLNQMQIAELFQPSKQNISKHIAAIYDDGESTEFATVNYQLTVQQEGHRAISRNFAYYNL